MPTVTTKDGSAIFYIFSGTAATHHYKYRPAAICAAKAWSIDVHDLGHVIKIGIVGEQAT